MNLEQRKKWFGVLLVTPGLVWIFAIVIYPLGYGILLSFYKAHLLKLRKAKFTGFGNYEKLFADDYFWNAVSNTIFMTGLWTIFGAVVGLMMALALNREGRSSRVIGAVLVLPWIMPGVCIAYMCIYLFDERMGVMVELMMMFGIIENKINVFNDPSFAPWFIIIVTSWLAFPFFMTMFLAGLKSIPKPIEEAAMIDGAGGIAKFRYIILPYLKNIIVITTILSMVWGFNFFDLIYATTEGGPFSQTETLVILAQRMAFKVLDLGYTSALGVIWLLILMIFSVVYIKAMKVV
tara:strand:- start:157 stop:1032 length:876 start_codon:yes stop_codon:yes gene_type:complete